MTSGTKRSRRGKREGPLTVEVDTQVAPGGAQRTALFLFKAVLSATKDGGERMAQDVMPKRVPARSEVPEEAKWRLTDIFASDEAWEEAFQQAKAALADAGRYQGKVGESAQTLLATLKMYEDISRQLDRVAEYAMMRRDEDSTVSRCQEMAQRALGMYSQAGSALAYVTPEILAIPEETLWSWVDQTPELAVYRHYLEDLLRSKPHVLTPREEQILAEVGEIARGPETIFEMLNDADLRFGTVRDEDGNEVELSHGRALQLLRSRDRRVREETFKTYAKQYLAHRNTLAATYNAAVQRDVFYARMRKHGSALESQLHPDNIPLSVYDNLIKAVREFLPALHRYMRLRKRMLGLDELHMYDLYTPLVRDVSFDVPYDEAKKMVKAGLVPLGEEYQAALDACFEGRWIDVYENVGKMSGAYQRNVYGVHPYVLLNYQGKIDDVFTIAHELGHAMHSYFTEKKQPFIYANYSLFVAEVASTVNEVLLTHYLLDVETDPRRRLYVLNNYLEDFRSIVFRQTLFAEFEKLAHQYVEEGGALTADHLCQVYRGLITDYYGPEVTVDPEIDVEWARIPHFYYAFYVYKYATGFSAATALADAILSGREGAVDRYLEFLSAGSSDYPLNILAKAGVDMSTPEPVRQALLVFERLLDEMEILAEQHA